MIRSLQILIAVLFIGGFSSAYAQQVVPAGHTMPSKAKNNIGNVNKAAAVTCAQDTVVYPLAKLSGTSVSGYYMYSGNATGWGQWYPAPQAVTVSGFQIFSVVTDASTNKQISFNFRLYAAGADSLPSGAALASVSATVDTNTTAQFVEDFIYDINFSTPVTVPAGNGYVIIMENSTIGAGDTVVTYTSPNGDGALEDNAIVQFSGMYFHALGAGVDIDVLAYPKVTYDIVSDFAMMPDTICLGDTTWTNNMSTAQIAGNRYYSLAAFQGSPEFGYQWDMGDGMGFYMAWDTFHVYSAYGTYNVTLLDTIVGWSTACADMSTKQVFVDTSSASGCMVVGINDQSLEENVSIYPNPSNGILNIDINMTNASDVNVEIYDLVGNKVRSLSLGNVASVQERLDISNLAGGIYLVKIMTGTDAMVEKINLVK